MKSEEFGLDARNRADIEPILKEIVEILVRDYKPETIILFGSYAYGQPTRHSDIDLFIVKETAKGRLDRFVEVKSLIYKPERSISIQPIVYTPSELRERRRIGDYFVEDIFNKGEELYHGRKRPSGTKRRMVRVR
jgi:predicted nucleotidyltransferase